MLTMKKIIMHVFKAIVSAFWKALAHMYYKHISLQLRILFVYQLLCLCIITFFLGCLSTSNNVSPYTSVDSLVYIVIGPVLGFLIILVIIIVTVKIYMHQK